MSKTTHVQQPLFGPWWAWEQLPDSLREQALDVLTAIERRLRTRSQISAVRLGPDARQKIVSPLNRGSGVQYSSSRVAAAVIANTPQPMARPSDPAFSECHESKRSAHRAARDRGRYP